MVKFSDYLIEIVSKIPGLTDRQLTDVLKGKYSHPSQVNQEARYLERKDILKRVRRDDGRIGNYMACTSIAPTASIQNAPRPRLINPKAAQPDIPRAEIPSGAIVCISCVKSKRSYACEAKDLYTSALFCKMLAYAERLNPKMIFILSAKYGLLKLDDKIEPYEQTLKNMKSAERTAWAEKVVSELERQADLKRDHFVFLAGMPYRENLLPHIKNYSVPMEGLSFGRQLQWLEAQLS